MATRVQAAQRVQLVFGIHLGVYVAGVAGMAALNFIQNPDKLWALWVAGGWGLGVLLHGVLAFTPALRERAINKAMARMNSPRKQTARRPRRSGC